MKRPIALALALAALSGTAGPRAAGCDPAGNVRFVCDQVAPEDLAVVPGSDWVISSGMAANGAIRLINLKERTTTVLFPSAAPKERLDKKTYASCPGPIDPAEKERFRAHGLYLREGGNQRHTLYVVHHGNRESIEVFEFDARAKPPTLTWIGCAVAPDPIGLNSVVGLPDGGFITTNFQPRGPADAAARGRMMAGENNGELWEWHTASGWKKVPGSEAPGPNGLEISKDGKTLYIGGWGSQSVIRLSRGQTPAKRDSVNVGFRVDNVRWAPDGTLLAAGQGVAPAQTSNVARVDPNTLKSQELVRYQNSESFASGTVAIQLGSELWVGSVRGDRIAIFPATPGR